MIQPNSQRRDLLDTIKLILDFNGKFNYENENENEEKEKLRKNMKMKKTKKKK